MRTANRTHRTKRVLAVAAIAVAGLVLAACSGGGGSLASSGSGGGSGGGDGSLKPFKVAYVPSFDNAPYLYAQAHGYYKQAGLKVTLSPVDAGPAISAGVINGSYDAGSSALFPLLIAVSKGQPLKIFMTVDTIGPGLGNSGLIVTADSPIKGYKDLDGKTVATNALTSLTTLATKIAVDKAGGDSKSIKFLSLPFNSSVQAAERGQADAAVVISPFQTQAVLDGMQQVADPIGEMMPKGSPYGVLFTSADTGKAKGAEMAAFRTATERAMKALGGDEALQRQLAQSEAGLSAAVAQKVELPHYTTTIDHAATQQYADLVAQYGYTDKPVDVKSLILQ